MTNFATYLKEARLRTNLGQDKAAEELAAKTKNKKASQSLIAQYENGKVIDPDPEVLYALSKIYGADYFTMVHLLWYEKYKPHSGWNSLDEARWELLKAALAPAPTDIAHGSGLEEAQLRGKAAMVKELLVLDIAGAMEWERQFPNPQQLWVIAPDFLDDEDIDVFDTVSGMLKKHKDLSIIYFVNENDTKVGGRFSLLKQKFLHIDQAFDERILGIPLEVDSLTWLHTDLVVANAHHRGSAAGLQFIRRANRPAYAIAMEPSDLREVISALMRWASPKHEDFVRVQNRLLMLK